ncbi:MAG: hypothetical protein HY913_08730 [Desulfomonile tiedjei]|nr:hypothetical protein [Desulfomonile tiedjei]
MYWWNVSQLAEDLREGRVEEKERFKYYLAYIVSGEVILRCWMYFPETFNILTLMCNAASVIIVTTGVMLCYRANRNGDNTDFIGRMICLGWPVGIRLLVLAVIPGLALFPTFSLIDRVGTAMGYSWDQIKEAMLVPEYVLRLAFGILYFWLLYKYVKLVAQPKEAS